MVNSVYENRVSLHDATSLKKMGSRGFNPAKKGVRACYGVSSVKQDDD
ncbi:hypothetical protein [Acetobacter pasteurianus]|nr:hypothetical protein [Acetobacter pasteurianus]